MHVISEVQVILAGLRADNRGVVTKFEDVADRLKELAPKLKEEYLALKDAGVFEGLAVIVGNDGLPVPDSALGDYKRAKAELEKWLAKEPAGEAEPQEVPADEAPEPAPVAPDRPGVEPAGEVK